MSDHEPNAQDVPHRLEGAIGTLLRWGVVASLALLVVGTLVNFLHSAYGGDARLLIVADAPRDGLGQRLVIAGLILLIATPVSRVVVAIVGYAIERDGWFVVIGSIVLALLVASFLLGAAHG